MLHTQKVVAAEPTGVFMWLVGPLYKIRQPKGDVPIEMIEEHKRALAEKMKFGTGGQTGSNDGDAPEAKLPTSMVPESHRTGVYRYPGSMDIGPSNVPVNAPNSR